MFKVYYYNDSISCNSCCYCIVETEEEAKRICDFAINNKRYDTTDWYYQRYEVYVQTADKVIKWMEKEMREEKITNLEARIETYKEHLAKLQAELEELLNGKE